jgi:tRNA (guanine-N7-)-methyltransferase
MVARMSFDLGRGRILDDAPGTIGITMGLGCDLVPLPDAAMHDVRVGQFDPRSWFADRTRKFELEIGCGKGTFILETAGHEPSTNFLGIEWAREFYLYTADRIRRAGLTNVRMLHTDASDFLRWRVKDNVVDVIHLYFSDPWPKAKHHKNRVIQHRFLAEAWRVLSPGGELRIVTDHDALWAWDELHFDVWTNAARWSDVPEAVRNLWKMPEQPFERIAFTPPAWVGEGQMVATNYERKMCVEKPAHACVLRKRH